MAIAPHPKHPRAVFRVLKNAYRLYLKSGAALAISVTAPPNQVVAATTTVAGTVTPAAGVPLPASVSVALWNNAVLKATRTATVTAVTGAYTTTFPVSTMAAGPAYAVVTATSPAGTATSTTFTVT